MAIERIDSIFDIQTLNAEYNQFLGLTKGAKDSLMELYNTTTQFKDSNISTLTENTQKLSVAINGSLESTQKAAASYAGLTQKVSEQIAQTQNAVGVTNQFAAANDMLSKQLIKNKIANDDLVKSQKDNAKAYQDGRISLEQYEKALGEIKSQQDNLKSSNKDIVTTVNGQTDAYKALDAAYQKAAASAKTLQAAALAARQKASTTQNPEDEQQAALLTSQANKQAQAANQLNNSLKMIDSSVGESKRKVGDYTGALKILETGLFEVNAKIQQMAASGQQGTKAYADLTRQGELLNTILGQQEQGFSSITMQIRNSERALQTMRAEGLGDTEMFEQYRMSVAKAAQQQKEFALQQKLLESQTPLLASITLAAKGLAGAYAVGAGAAALFADGDEKVAKSLNQLVAIMTLLQGLQQAYELVQESGAIMLELKTVFLKKNTIALEENTVAQEVNAAATEGITTATGAAEAATISFTAVLAASGIGAVVIGLIAMYEILTSVGSTEKEAAEKALELDEAIDRLNETLAAEATLLNTVQDNLKNQLEIELSYSEKAKGTYNEQYQIKKQIAAVDLKIAENNINSAGGLDKINAQIKEGAKNLEALNKQKEDLDKKDIDAVNKKNKPQGGVADPYGFVVGFESLINSKRASNAKAAAEAVDKDYQDKKKSFDNLIKLRNDYNTANKNSEDVEIDNVKHTEEEIVKQVEQAAKIRAEAIIQVNQFILSNERSTQQQRLQAQQTILTEQIRIIEAEKTSKLSDTSLSDKARAMIEADAQAAINKATVQTLEERRKLNEDYRLRNLAAQTEYNKDLIDQQAAAAAAIYTNDKKSLDDRLKAYTDYYDAQRALADNELHGRLSAAGFSDQEIDAIKNGDKVRVEGKKITADELLAIEGDYNAKIVDVNSKTQKNVNDIVVSWAKKNADDVDKANKENSDSSATLNYNKQLSALNKSLADKLISIKEYNKKREALDQQFHITQEAENLNADQKSIDALKKNQKEINAAIAKNTNDLVKAKEGGNQEQIDAAQSVADALIQANIDANGKIKEADKKLADDQKSLVEESVKFYIGQKDIQAKQEKQLAEASADYAKELVDASFERENNKLQKQIDLNDRLDAAETKRIDNSSLSEQEKANELIILQKTTATQDEQLKKKQRDEKVKEAKFDRDVSVAKIAGTTAEAVIALEAKAAEAFATAAVLAADPLTSAYAGVALASAASIESQVGLTIALGAVQVASVLSKPIPTYFIGTDNHPGGLAKVHSGEIVSEPNKAPFLTPDGETVMNLAAKTKVIPKSKVDEMVSAEMRVNRFGTLEFNSNAVEKKIDKLTDAIVWQTEQLKPKPVRRTTNNTIIIDGKFAQRIQKSIYD